MQGDMQFWCWNCDSPVYQLRCACEDSHILTDEERIEAMQRSLVFMEDYFDRNNDDNTINISTRRRSDNKKQY